MSSFRTTPSWAPGKAPSSWRNGSPGRATLSALAETVTRPVLVQKFGGTSLGTPGRITRAAKRIAASQRAGYDVVAVGSAIGDSTDRLPTLAGRGAEEPTAPHVGLLL